MVFFFFFLLASIHLAENMITDWSHGFLVTVQMLEERIIFIFLFSSFFIFRSFSIFFPFFFFTFFFFSFFFFCLGEAPLRGFFARSRLCILCIL